MNPVTAGALKPVAVLHSLTMREWNAPARWLLSVQSAVGWRARETPFSRAVAKPSFLGEERMYADPGRRS